MDEIVVSVPPAASFLSVGLPLKISLTLHQQKVMFGSTLLGWKDHAWLICERPIQLGHDQLIAGGTPCTVSYIHEGKLVGYRSEIRDLITLPVPLLFIAYPKTVEEMHLRKHLRVSANEPLPLDASRSEQHVRVCIACGRLFRRFVKGPQRGRVQCAVGSTAYLVAPWNRAPSRVRTSWIGTHYESHGHREECRQAAWRRHSRHRVSIQQTGIHRIPRVGRIRQTGSRAMRLPEGRRLFFHPVALHFVASLSERSFLRARQILPRMSCCGCSTL